MRLLITITLSLMLLSGCVTQTLVDGVPVDQSQHKPKNKIHAAQNRLALAINYLRAGDSQLALQNIEQAAKDAPDLIDVDLTRGYFYSYVKQPDKAVAAYQRVLKRQPANGDALNNLGVIQCRENQYSAAEALFRKALNSPGYSALDSTNENAGLCAYRSGEYDKAKSYFLSALAYNAQRPRSLLGLANVLIRQHHYQDARIYLRRYGQVTSTTPSSLLAWIRLTRGEGNLTQQVLWGKELMTRFPDAPETKQYLADDY
ncbi:type IV pilus biogenesis/stability protein PilW [Celerinatantimonas sp. YJH-8]|uniref:type IV pilus biogenesis/stability protein PilW n=1 Tax=Celerinatantimonas sp. YJH-8 TaxID=3228714 RepID=UPI0038C7700C